MMHKLILKKIIFYILIINVLFITIIPFSYTAQNFIYGFILSHYLALIIHNIFLGISNHIICQYIDIECLIVQRTGCYKYLWLIAIISFFQIIMYFLFLLLYGIIMFGINNTFSSQSIYLIFLYFIIIIFSHFILLIQIFMSKNNLYLIVAVIINLYVHYFLLIPNF